MMSDYVVKPKRRRNGNFKAVDPCLGYYIPLATGTYPMPEDLDILNAIQESRVELQTKTETVITDGMATNESDLGPKANSFSCAGELERLQQHDMDGTSSDSDVPMDIKNTRGHIVSPSSTSSSLECVNADWATVISGPAASARDVTRLHHGAPPRPQEAEPLTVDVFLKRSCAKTYTSKRKRERQKRVLRTKQITKNLLSGNLEYRDNCEDEDVDADASMSASTVQLRSRTVTRVITPASKSSSSESEVEMSSNSYEAPSPAPSTKKQMKLQKTSKKSSRSLRKRIYEAAISTHGDPNPYFAYSTAAAAAAADDSTRVPMLFLPGASAPSAAAATKLRPSKYKTKKTKKGNWSLIDPRKCVAIRTATFSSRIRPPHLAFNNNTDCVSPSDGKLANASKGLGKWKWDTRLGAPSIDIIGLKRSLDAKMQEKDIKVRTQDASSMEFGVKPLVFVTMYEAEDGYSSLFAGRGAQTARKTKPEAKSGLQLGPVQDHVSPRRGTERQELEQLKEAAIEQCSQPTEITTEAFELTTKSKLHEVALSEVSSAQAITSRPRSNYTLEILSPSVSPPGEVSTAMLTPQKNYVPRSLKIAAMVDGKPLQPLASFTDKIMATILTVNRAEGSKIVPVPTNTFRNNKRLGSSKRPSSLTT